MLVPMAALMSMNAPFERMMTGSVRQPLLSAYACPLVSSHTGSRARITAMPSTPRLRRYDSGCAIALISPVLFDCRERWAVHYDPPRGCGSLDGGSAHF